MYGPGRVLRRPCVGTEGLALPRVCGEACFDVICIWEFAFLYALFI